MFKLLSLISTILVVTSALPRLTTRQLVEYGNRIVGGEEIDISERPYQVALNFRGSQMCGGAIVNERTIVTAAHCAQYQSTGYSIRAGSNSQYEGGVVINVAQVINHPQYNKRTFDYDIAIMKLAEPLTFTDKIQPAKLAEPGFLVPDNEAVIVSGWGDLEYGTGNYPDLLPLPRQFSLSGNRIVGGVEVDITERPFQIALNFRGSQICGGAIVNADTIITAAHCSEYTTSGYSIRAGSTSQYEGGVVVNVVRVIVHPKYNKKTLDYDVAIMKLAEPLTFSDKIQPVELAAPGLVVPDNEIVVFYRNTILTAAHCTQYAASAYQIRAGSNSQYTGGQVIQASRVINHPNYNSQTFDYDVAIVKLVSPLTYTDRVKPIQLATSTTSILDGHYARVTGWGDLQSGSGTYPEFLRYIITLLSAALVAVSAAPQTFDTRIVGGEQIDISYVPYQILLMLNGRHTCGGAIVNEITILTAAHCTQNSASVYSVRAGSNSQYTGGQVIQANRVINHPQYNSRTFDNDVSIVKLVSGLTYNDRVQPVPLATPQTFIPDGAIARIAGWGDLQSGSGTYPEFLRYVDVPVVNQETCKRSYSTLTERMICAGLTGKSTCQGDSGGPLVYNGVHIGIVSHAVGCAFSGYPTVYSRTGALRSFIDQYV
uniref:CSON009631 protein n=1 Tax=Culicoides sonorensis TaxID=179676 RepID=A0A336M3B4_CULSO